MISKIRKVSNFMQKRMPLFILIDIILAMVIGFYYQDIVNPLKAIIPFGMFLMLYPMMVGVVIEDLRLVSKDLKILLIAVSINFIISPLIAFFWAKMFFSNLDPNFIAGWFLKLTVPSAGMAVAWTGLSKGKVETALVIQVISYLLAIIAIPFWMLVLAGSLVPINLWLIIKTVLMIIVIPFVLGILTREGIIKKWGAKIYNEDVKPFLAPFSSLGMYLIIFIAVSGEAVVIFNNLPLILKLAISVLIVYPFIFWLSLKISKFFKIRYENAIAIAFSSTAKNHGITLAIVVVAFGGLAIIPPSFVPLIQVLMMLSIWKLSSRIKKRYEG